MLRALLCGTIEVGVSDFDFLHHGGHLRQGQRPVGTGAGWLGYHWMSEPGVGIDRPKCPTVSPTTLRFPGVGVFTADPVAIAPGSEIELHFPVLN